MEISRAEIAAIYDAHGRLVITPNALTTEGQRNIPCDLQPGESLLSFLRRHIDGVESGAWAVSIGGCTVPRAMWGKTFPKHGMHIACRATVGKQAVQLVAIAALAWFAPWAAGAIGNAYGLGAMAVSAISAGIFVAGSVLINKVLGPKVDKSAGGAAAEQVHSLRGQRNTPRPYEPIGVLFGEMRVTPDLANQPYAWYAGDTQFLSTQLLGGVNVYSAHDLSNGDTALSAYSDTVVYFDGFPGMESQAVPLYSNADTLAGGELLSSENVSAGWVTRTTSPDTIRIEIDTEGMLHTVNSKGGSEMTTTRLTAEYAVHGSGDWQPLHAYGIYSNQPKTFRHTHGNDVAKGQYDVRVKVNAASHYEPGRSQLGVTWTSLRSVQPDATDYSQFGRIAIKMKATGQLSGSLDMLRATFRACPMPIWTGTEWVTATTRENGLSNPGAILLLTLRGIYRNGKLQFGYGLSDEQIDIEGLKAFMLYCTANGYTYDRWLTQAISLQDFCQEVALAGMGEFSWTDGSRPTAVFVASGQPVSAVVNMANMLKSSFSVDYALSNAADGIEYQYVDRTKDFETVTLRVTAPGVTTMLNPARVTGVGVTTEAHAARMARYHLAQSLYQYKTIGYTADIEHLDYRRLSVLSVSHDLTQWGFGGRVASAKRVGGQVHISLGETVPVLTTPHLGLRLPGDRDYRVWPVQSFANGGETLVLAGQWPEGVPLPGEDGPAHDTLWCYDFKATPGYKVRVVGLEPEGDLKGAKVTCVPEGPEFWDYVINGTYVPAPNQSVIPQLGRCAVTNLRISEQVNVQGDTEWSELNAIWDTEGDYDHAQVWAGRDGSELRMVDGNAVGARSTWRIDGPGEWLVEVRPFNSGGQGGTSAAALYITTMTARPPRNVDQFTVQEVAGGLRRFAWQYTGDAPPALAGVQIRYLPGDVALGVDTWGSMIPLGQPNDIYSAQFETTRPEAGVWTFGIRAIDTSGQLSPGVLRVVKSLGSSFEQVQQPDLTPPPAPTGFAASGLFATVQASWDTPAYTVGHGHARTEVWAGASTDRALAKKVAEGVAGPASFEWGLGSKVYAWARHISNDDVAGAWAGPVSAQTAENVEQLLDVLEGQITESQLHQDLSAPIELLQAVPPLTMQELVTADLGRIPVIDRIDKAGGPLGKSLLESAASLEATQQLVRFDMDNMAQGLLEAALAADAALERITDAGVYVEPGTGQVKIYGLEVTKENVTSIEVLLDAVQGQLALKATTAYVDGKIAEAVLLPADLLLYEGLDARLVQVTQTLDGINGTLAQKASQLELTNAVVRLTSAESTLDALSGQIALRVTRAEYEADQDALQQRLGSAEILLNALDVPSITATVQAASNTVKDAEKQAEALLRDILSGEAARTSANEALAFARNELTAAIQDGLAAEAAQRLQLGVQVGSNAAAIEQESIARAATDHAEALQREQLAVQVASDKQETLAAIESERLARADADAAEALARESLKAQLDGVDDALLAAIEEEQIARVNADAAEAVERQLLAARMEQADSALQASIESEQSARADAVSAEASRTDALMAVSQKQASADAERNAETLLQDILTGDAARDRANEALAVVRGEVTAKIEEGLSAEAGRREMLAAAIGQQAALIEQESLVRATADAAEALQRSVLATQVANEQQQIRAQIVSESQARADGDAAEASQRQQLAARVDGKDGELQAAIVAEQNARASADAAEATQRQLLAATVAANRTEGLDAVDVAFGAIASEQTARANADVALGQRVDQVQAGVAGNTAAIQAEQQARATAISAEAMARQTLAATVSNNHSAALAAAQAASDAAGSKGKVLFQSAVPSAADRLPQNLWIDTTGGVNTPKRWTGSAWVAATDKVAADAAAAAAQAQATANNAVAAIQTEQSVRATETGHLGAQYTVRMQLGQGGQQVVGGFGLSGTSSGTAGARIDFGVLANSFWVAAPNGSGVANVKPFSVQTTAQTVNGVVVPAGVYMDAAYINNVTVLFGRFGTLIADTIQATAISASQLTAGSGVIGGSLKSSNYVAGSSGWTLRPDGVAEFSGVTVRGTVYATSGTVGGWSIGSNYLRSSNYQAGVRGVSFGADGSVEIRSNDGSRVFNLQATGIQSLLKIPGLELKGDGSGTFTGDVVTGLMRNADFSNFINMKAAGSADALSFGSGKARITASGSAHFEDVTLSREMTIAEGVTTGFQSWMPFPANEISRAWQPLGRVWVDTGIVVPAWGVAGRQGYAAVAAVTSGGVYIDSSSGTVNWGFECQVVPKSRWSGSSTLHIAITFFAEVVSGSPSNVRCPGNVGWRLIRLT